MNVSYGEDSRYIVFAYKRTTQNLLRLLYVCKFYGINHKLIYRNLKKWVFNNYTDIQIINCLKKMVNKPKHTEITRDRGNTRVNDITELFTNSVDLYGKHILPCFTKYLDIGAGDCVITKSLAQFFGIKKGYTYAIDIESWSNKSNEEYGKDSQINYIYIDPPVDEKSEFNHTLDENTFDIITIFQTLHHMKNFINVIKDVYRLLKPGGIVIIREHDARSNPVRALCHIEHLIYGIFADKMCSNEFYKEYYGHYYSKREMINVFENHGFTTLSEKSKNNPTLYYYQVFKKMNTT